MSEQGQRAFSIQFCNTSYKTQMEVLARRLAHPPTLSGHCDEAGCGYVGSELPHVGAWIWV